MRIGVFLVCLGWLAATAPAVHAASEAPKLKVPAKPKLPTGLRGSVQPGAPPVALGARAPAAPALKPPLAPFSPLAATAPDTGQCRTDCAHAYYFCLSGSVTSECAETWSQCLTDCSHPPLTLRR